MKTLTRKTLLAATLALALVSAAGCAELPTNEAACADSSGWFERQRQLVDGHADPYAAAIDAPCRVSAQSRGIVVVEGARRS